MVAPHEQVPPLLVSLSVRKTFLRGLRSGSRALRKEPGTQEVLSKQLSSYTPQRRLKEERVLE